MKKENLIFILPVVIVLYILFMKRRGVTNTIMKTVFNDQFTPNFNLSELLTTSTGLPNIPNEVEKENLRDLAFYVLQPVRDLLQVPVTINSAFRSAGVNAKVGGVANSQHRTGNAADIVPKMNLDDAFKKIARSKIPFDQLIIEVNERGNRWIHISFNPNGGRRQLLSAHYDANQNKMIYNPVTV